MRKDLEIQKKVMEEIKWIPSFEANEIGASVKNGIVTLSGEVDSYPKKIKVERAVRQVEGVRGIAEDIVVKVKKSRQKSDSEIAAAVLNQLQWHSNLDAEKITFEVEDGEVTLEGEVEWDFQRKEAAKSIGNLSGVKGVINNIKISVIPAPRVIKDKIIDAFKRNANMDAEQIFVEQNAHVITLRGKVRNLDERESAEKIAWQAKGVTEVINLLETSEELVY